MFFCAITMQKIFAHVIQAAIFIVNRNLEFEFRYDMASFLDSHSDKISLAGLGRLTGINRKQLSHYLTRKRNPSRKTVKKIEAALHEFGEEISRVHFI